VKRQLKAIALVCDAPGLPTDSLTLARIQFVPFPDNVYDLQGNIHLQTDGLHDEDIFPWFRSLGLDPKIFEQERKDWFDTRHIHDSISNLTLPKIVTLTGILIVSLGLPVSITEAMTDADPDPSLVLMGSLIIGPGLFLIGNGLNNSGLFNYKTATSKWVEKALYLYNRKVILEYFERSGNH
jgi:hypothetical protein